MKKRKRFKVYIPKKMPCYIGKDLYPNPEYFSMGDCGACSLFFICQKFEIIQHIKESDRNGKTM